MRHLFIAATFFLGFTQIAFAQLEDENFESSASTQVEETGRIYQSHTISGTIPARQKAYAWINYKIVRVDCRGLGFIYRETRAQTQENILITKQNVPRVAIACPPGIRKEVQAGYKVDLKPNFSGRRILTEIVVPEGSIVTTVGIDLD